MPAIPTNPDHADLDLPGFDDPYGPDDQFDRTFARRRRTHIDGRGPDELAFRRLFQGVGAPADQPAECERRGEQRPGNATSLHDHPGVVLHVGGQGPIRFVLGQDPQDLSLDLPGPIDVGPTRSSATRPRRVERGSGARYTACPNPMIRWPDPSSRRVQAAALAGAPMASRASRARLGAPPCSGPIKAARAPVTTPTRSVPVDAMTRAAKVEALKPWSIVRIRYCSKARADSEGAARRAASTGSWRRGRDRGGERSARGREPNRWSAAMTVGNRATRANASSPRAAAVLSSRACHRQPDPGDREAGAQQAWTASVVDELSSRSVPGPRPSGCGGRPVRLRTRPRGVRWEVSPAGRGGRRPRTSRLRRARWRHGLGSGTTRRRRRRHRSWSW